MADRSQAEPNPLHPPHSPPASGWPLHPAMVTSGLELPGFVIAQSFGVVRGLTVRSPGLGGSFSAAFQSLAGGSVETLREMCEAARREAFVLMMKDAARFGANGIIGFRYDTNDIGQGLTEVLAYGTAVWCESEG